MDFNRSKRKTRLGVRSHVVENEDYDLTMIEMFERFITFKKSEGIAERTIRDYFNHFQYFCDFTNGDLSKREITSDLLTEYLNYMIHDRGFKPMTVNVRIRSLRVFIRYSFLEGWIDKPVHEKFKPIKVEEDTIESLTPVELKSLFAAIDNTRYVGLRDRAMLYVLLDTMCRSQELITMKRSNVDIKAGQILLEAGDTKTRKFRYVPISSKTQKILKEYMLETSDFEDEEDILWFTYDGRNMSSNHLRQRMRELGEIAGIKGKRVSPHTLRHTGALLYTLNGGDPFSLQKILGHTTMDMVRKYIQMTNANVKSQHNLFSPLNQVFKR